MTDHDLPVSRRGHLAVGLALAALLVLTRLGHFGELSRLPDASWAVFFLGGLALRNLPASAGFAAFAGFCALAWGVDVAAFALGTPGDCFSAAYLFLVPAHGLLWWGGRLVGTLSVALPSTPPRWVASAVVLGVATSAAFAVSNVGYFLFGDHVPLAAGEYAARVAPYLPRYVTVTAIYAGAALLAHAGVVALRRAAHR